MKKIGKKISALREKCSDTEFFWSVFNPSTGKYGPSTGKYGPEKTPYLDNFHAVQRLTFLTHGKSNSGGVALDFYRTKHLN